MMRYGIALWLTPGSSGAEFVDELSVGEVIVACDAAGTWVSGDVALSAIFALMHRFSLRSVYAAAVMIDGSLQWRYHVSL